MILKRLKKYLKEQNWLAVFLEMLIVMFSLFLAFQLDRWAEEQRNTREVNNQLRLIRQEVDQLISYADTELRGLIRKKEEIDLILNIWDQKSLPDSSKEEFDEALNHLYRLRGSSYEIPNLTLLIESGRIEHIQNPAIKEAFQNYMTTLREAGAIRDKLKVTLNGLNEISLQYISYKIPEDDADTNEADGWYSMHYDLERLLQSREFRYAVGNTGKVTSFSYNNVVDFKADLQQLAETIDRELAQQ